jgi:hypothetical protein
MPSKYTCIDCGRIKNGYKILRCASCAVKSRIKRKENETKEEYYMSWFRHKEYGLEYGEFENWFMVQHGKCAICKQNLVLNTKTRKNRACLDHDHKTGKIRGILCHTCNIGLGMFQDDPALLKKAAEWVL